ncbi:MAG: ATP-binding cassette domain-containing protein, partial [Spirochaetota bacterium]
MTHIEQTPVLSVRNLKKHFPIRTGVFSRVSGHVRAVDGISFDINAGETFALVGESGCGKSTTGRAILRLTNPTSGEVMFAGEDVLSAGSRRMRELRR